MNIFKQKLARCNAKNEHYKMYKVGREWLFASASVLAMSQFLLVGTAKADTTDATATDTPATTQVTTANTAATSSAATLKTAPTTKTTPTTDTVKANAGTKENNQVQTDTKNAATKQNNAQQTPAATTGDKVTTAVKPSATQQPAETTSQKAPVKTASATDNQPAATADSTQKSASKTAVTATDPKAATTTAATQANSKTTDTTQKASTPNNQKTSQAVSAPDQAQQVKLPAGTKISVDAAGTTVYALPVNADLKAAQAAIAASGIKGPVEITVAADQISVNVNTSTYYYGDTPAQNAAQKGTDKPFYSGNVGDTIDTSKLGTTDADLKAAFADPSDPNGVYTVQVGADPQLYNSLTAAIAANPKLAAGDIKVVYYSGSHFGFHDDQGQVQYLDKNLSAITRGWMANNPSSVVLTVKNAPAGKIDMTAFNKALNEVKTTSNGQVNVRKTALNTAQDYLNSLASFKDGQVNANLVKSQDEPMGANRPGYVGANTSTGNNFKQEMTLYETQLQAVKTFLNSFTADSQKTTATGAATQGTAELQAVLRPISQTLADLAGGLTQSDPYVSEPYVGPQIDGLSATPTLFDAMSSLGNGSLGSPLTAAQAAQVSALITSLNDAANERDTAAAAVGAVSGIDNTLPTPTDATQTANKKNVTDALTDVNIALSDAQQSSSFDPNADGDDNNATVVNRMNLLAQAVNAATAPYSLEPTVAPLKAALTTQIGKTNTPDDLAALNTAMTTLITELNKVASPARSRANKQANAIINAVKNNPDPDTQTEMKNLQNAVTNAAADKGTTQDIIDAMTVTVPVNQQIKYVLAPNSGAKPAGFPTDTTRTVRLTVAADPQTDAITYTEKTFPDVTAPTLTGYTSSVSGNDSSAITDPTKAVLGPVKVTYAVGKTSIQVNYVDEDKHNAPVTSADTTLNGTIGAAVTYTAVAPTNYTLDGTPDIPATFGATDQTVTVKLKHQLVTAKDAVTTTRTINYAQKAGDPALVGTLPAGQTQTVKWNSITDKVTNKITGYTVDTGNFDVVTAPAIAGYTATVQNGDAVSTLDTTTTPTDPANVTVTYSANPQNIAVSYVDEDNGNAPVTDLGTLPTQLDGVTGGTVTYTPAAPANYTVDGTVAAIPTNFGNGTTAQTITVKLKHATTTNASITTTRTINYVQKVGDPTAPAGTFPTEQTQNVTWTSVTDQVTGKTTYTPSGNYAALNSKTVNGYTADGNAQLVTNVATQTKPTDPTVIVTYTANPQSIKVNFVDQDGNALGSTITLTGVSDGNVDYTPALTEQQSIINNGTGYTLKGKNNNGLANAPKTFTDYGKVPTYTVELTKVTPIKVTVNLVPVDADGNPIPNTTPIAVTGVPGTTVTTPTSTTAPDLQGYTPANTTTTIPVPKVTVVNGKKVSTPDQNVNVTYTANPQTIAINYVDEDNNNAAVTSSDTVLKGVTGGKVTYTAVAPDHYTIDGTPTIPSNFGNGSATSIQSITIKLKHQIVNNTVNTTRDINYVQKAGDPTAPAGTLPANTQQTVVWNTSTDEVTGTTKYSVKNGSFAAVTAPGIAGYTANIQGGDAVPTTNATTLPTNPAAATVTYTAKPQTITINYVDTDLNNTIVNPTQISGVTNGAVNYAIQIPTNYVQSGNPTFSGTNLSVQGQMVTGKFGTSGQTITINLVHGAKQAANVVTTTRNISYALASGDTLAPGLSLPKSKSQTLSWSTNTDLVTGVTQYTPSGNYGELDSPVLPGYTPDKGTVGTVEFPTITGSSPANSSVANLTDVVTYSANQVTKIVTVPSNKGDQSVPEVTGKTNHHYTINVPTIKGYTPDKTTVSVTVNTDGTITVDNPTTTGKVTYKADSQTINVTYLDVDNGNQQVGTPQAYKGVTDGTVDITKIPIPTNYVLATKLPSGVDNAINVPDTFDNDDKTDQPGTVYLQHKHQTSTVSVANTVTYTGLPAEKSQTINWTKDTDLVTNTTTYTPAQTTVTIDSPSVAGYTPDKTTVSFTLAPSTTEPTGQKTKVTYTPNTQMIQVSFVDQNGQDLSDVLLRGVSDENVDYTKALTEQQNLINIGYTLKKSNNNGLDVAPKTFTDYGNVPTYTVELSQVTPVKNTVSVVPVGADGTTPITGTTPIPVNGLPGTQANTPTVPGYTTTTAKVNIPATKDGTVKVTYTPDNQSINVQFVDQNGTKLGDAVNLIGTSNSKIDYTDVFKQQQTLLNQGYTVTKDSNGGLHGLDTATKTFTDFGKVPTYTIQLTKPQPVSKKQVPDNAPTANQYTVNFTDYNGKVVGTTTVVGNPGNGIDVKNNIPKGYVPTPGNNTVVNIPATQDPTKPLTFNVTWPAGQVGAPQQSQTKTQTNSDVPSANQYTIDFKTPDGKVVGTTTVVGNPGDKFDVTTNVPSGFVPTPGIKTIEVTVPKGQDPTKPLTVNVTWPAGQVGDPQQSQTKTQTNSDEPSANQYTVNFITPDGRVVGTTTVDGNPGSSFDVTNKIPNGFEPATNNDSKGTIANDQDSGTAIDVNVKTKPVSPNHDQSIVTQQDHDTGQQPADPTNPANPTAGPDTDIKSNGTQPGAAVNAQPGKTSKGESTGSQPGVAVKPKKKNVKSSPVSVQGKSNPSNNGETTALNDGEAVSGKSAAGQGTADAYAVTTANSSNQATAQGQQAAAQQTVAQSQQQAAAQSQGQAQVNSNNQGQNQNANKGQLPQTNESQSSVMATIGLGLLSLFSAFGLGKKRRKSDDQ